MPKLVMSGAVQSKEYLLEGWDKIAEAFKIMLSGEFEGVGKPLVVVGKE
jgi:NADPH-dependent curcumin reductase CurA